MDFDRTVNPDSEDEFNNESETQPFSDSQPISQTVLMTPEEESWGFLSYRKIPLIVPIVKNEFIVGRDTNTCDHVIGETTLGRHFRSVSRLHFKISREQIDCGIYVVHIKDLSSSGTFLNHRLIGKNNSRPISDEDKISISKAEIEVFTFYDLQYKNKIPGIPSDITSNYLVLKDIGKGGFGNVYFVIKKSSSEKLAMKAIKWNPDVQSEIPLNEVSIMYQIKHINIVRVFHTYVIGEDIFIIMEFVEGGDLYHYLKDRKVILQECEAKFIFYQLVQSVSYLHRKNIVHRDIKPLNILCSKKTPYPHVKLTDFGLSKILNRHIEPVRTLCGTKTFAAPELNMLFSGSPCSITYDSRCDVWSLGLIFYYCLSLRLPFEEKAEQPPLATRIQKLMYRFEPATLWRNVSQDAKLVIHRLLKVDHKERPWSSQISVWSYFNMDTQLLNRYQKLTSSAQEQNHEMFQDENDQIVRVN